MNGQIEGLEIGGEAIGLWNYKKAEAIKVFVMSMFNIILPSDD